MKARPGQAERGLIAQGGDLGGIIVVMLFSTKATRDRDAELREQDARTLAYGLFAEITSELVSLSSAYEEILKTPNDENSESVTDLDTWWSLTFEGRRYPIYSGNIERLGLLPGELVWDVVLFYEGCDASTRAVGRELKAQGRLIQITNALRDVISHGGKTLAEFSDYLNDNAMHVRLAVLRKSLPTLQEEQNNGDTDSAKSED